MSIFKEMYERRQFPSCWEYKEVRRMLAEAMNGGYVEKIAVMKPHPFVSTEEWYRDKETGEIYSLVPPEDKMRGHWEKVNLESLIEPNEKLQ